ncbi:fatty acid--CoA ligase family protein [Pseudonocardia sp. NPDC049154]|uniref:class I adenylate-forming enzyme family protein n=1 Tax=Pseudonocardia sp. NPDC049154 TaxID=3155501 RepID=UPI0033DE518D
MADIDVTPEVASVEISNPPALSLRIRAVLEAAPDDAALLVGDRVLPWSWLGQAVADLDGVCSRAGTHRVGIVLRNRPATFAALVATIATGREVVILSPFHGDVALEEDLRQLAPGVVVADPEDLDRPRVPEAAAAVAAVVVRTGTDRALTVPTDVPRGGGGSAPDGTAVLMVTSGTTGKPKRVRLGYTELAAALTAAGTPVEETEIRIRSRPAILWASLVHIGGLYFALANVASGQPTALLERFEVEPWAELVRRTRPKVIGLPPAALRMVLRSDLPPDAFAGVLTATSGTAALDPDDADRFRERFGIPILATYGATEFAGAVASWDLALHEEWGDRKRGSVGRPHRGITMRVVDPESGEPLPAGATGLLEARGPQLPQRGWVRTTDLASLDTDGFLYIHGRIDDVINRGGFKIVPSVIEEALEAHPAVRDASAVGLPDERLGQVPVAAVTLLPDAPATTPADLRAFLAERLARYHLPTEIRIVDALPRTPSLKVSRPDVVALFHT